MAEFEALCADFDELGKPPACRKHYVIRNYLMKRILNSRSGFYFGPNEVDLVYAKFIHPCVRQMRRRIRERVRSAACADLQVHPLDLLGVDEEVLPRPRTLGIADGQRIVDHVVAPFLRVRLRFPASDLLSLAAWFEDRLARTAELTGSADICALILERHREITRLLDS